MEKIEPGDVVTSKEYLFEYQAEQEAKILNAVRSEAKKRKLGIHISVQNTRSGKLITGSKEEIITINCGGFSPIYLFTRVIGTYLYVNIITMSVIDLSKVENIIMAVSFKAYWQACIDILETAFINLGIKPQAQKFPGL